MVDTCIKSGSSDINITSISPKRFNVTNTKKGEERLGRFKLPDHIVNNKELNDEITKISNNYNFEFHKTLWFLEQKKAKKVVLQFPEGLIMFACQIADLLEKYSGCEIIIMGDIVYGACCVDDITAHELSADILVHYGHSCLVPINETCYAKILYVFVDMKIDENHLLITIRHSFTKAQKISMVSTIQFVLALQNIHRILLQEGYNINIEQTFPLSRGEILGCTSPKFSKDTDVLLYVGDGRFHVESAMIQNPTLPAYRYDPYNKILTREELNFKHLMSNRKKCIDAANIENGTFGVVLGTLGRQGSIKVLRNVNSQLDNSKYKDYINILMSEVTPEILLMFNDSIDAFVQIACPRLSIDWGHSFHKPTLTSYELSVVCGTTKWDDNYYPMDYYSKDSMGPWTPNHQTINCSCKKI